MPSIQSKHSGDKQLCQFMGCIQSKSNEDHPCVTAFVPLNQQKQQNKNVHSEKKQHLPCIKILFCHTVIQLTPGQHLLFIIRTWLFKNRLHWACVCYNTIRNFPNEYESWNWNFVIYYTMHERINEDFMLALPPHSPSTQERAPLRISS